MMMQYNSIKNDPQYAGSILLFQLGNFLEAFHNDAVTISRVLGIALTTRGNAGADGSPIPMAGVPLHARDSYISRLVKAGHRVVVVEQVDGGAAAASSGEAGSAGKAFKRRTTTQTRMGTATNMTGSGEGGSSALATPQGLMKRRVAEIVTRGTATDDSLLSPRSRNLIASLSFIRSPVSLSSSAATGGGTDGSIEAGIAWVDISTGDFFTARCPTLSAISSELAVNPPVELLVPSFLKTATTLTMPGQSTTRAMKTTGSDTLAALGIEQLKTSKQQPAGKDVFISRVTEAVLANTTAAELPSARGLDRRTVDDAGSGSGSGLVIDFPGSSGSEVEPLTLTLLHGSLFSPSIGSALIAEASNAKDAAMASPSSSAGENTNRLSLAELSAAAGLLRYVSWTQQGRMPVLRPPVSLSADTNTSAPVAPGVTTVRVSSTSGEATSSPLLTRVLAAASSSAPAPRMSIDPATRRSLEITRPINGRRRARGSLLHTLDLCVTAVGSRLLDQRLCSPLIHSQLLNHRLDAVSYLRDNDNLRESLRQCLQAFPDLERSMHRVAMRRGGAPSLMRDLLLVRDGLAAALRLGVMLASGDHVKFSVNGNVTANRKRVPTQGSALSAGEGEEEGLELVADEPAPAATASTATKAEESSSSSGVKSGFIISAKGFEGFSFGVRAKAAVPAKEQAGKASTVPVIKSSSSNSYEEAVAAASRPLVGMINSWTEKADRDNSGKKGESSSSHFYPSAISSLVELGCRYDYDVYTELSLRRSSTTTMMTLAEKSLVLALAAAGALLPHGSTVAASVYRELTAALDPPVPTALVNLCGSAPEPSSADVLGQDSASSAGGGGLSALSSSSGIRIRSGYHHELDAARALRDSANTAVAGLQNKLRAATGIRNLKVKMTEEHGCVAEVPVGFAEALERQQQQQQQQQQSQGEVVSNVFPFRRLKTLKATVRFTCPALQQLDREIREASYRCDYLENAVLSSLCAKVTSAAQELASVARAVAVIDVSSSLAEAAKRYSLNRPEFAMPTSSSSRSLLELRSLRHLVVERALMSGWVHRATGMAHQYQQLKEADGNLADGMAAADGGDASDEGTGSDDAEGASSNGNDDTDDDRGFESRGLPDDPAPPSAFVPNDCLLGLQPQSWRSAATLHNLFAPERQPSAHVAVLSGSNMAGKSTWLRSVAHCVALAQMGSFVPADVARFSLVDKLFARVGASDDVSRGRSTFLVEAEETAHILTNATSSSLTLIDEIGRGTSSVDGVAIAYSVLEHLAETIKCRTLFSSHIHELTAMALIAEAKKNSTRPPTTASTSLSFSPSIQCLHMEAVDDVLLSKELQEDEENEGDGEGNASVPHLTHRIAPHPLIAFMREQLSSGATMAQVEEALWKKISTMSSHGVAVARRAGIPSPVLKRASQISKCLEESSASQAWGKKLSKLL
jgi:DNA mismatch repair ATPase MutS